MRMAARHELDSHVAENAPAFAQVVRHGGDVRLIAIYVKKAELRLEYVFLGDKTQGCRLRGVDPEHRSEACVILACDAGFCSSMQPPIDVAASAIAWAVCSSLSSIRCAAVTTG